MASWAFWGGGATKSDGFMLPKPPFALDSEDIEAEDNAIQKIDSSYQLYNDVHFRPAQSPDNWPYFPQLPPELRRHVWLLFLKQHRMIELTLVHHEDERRGDYPGGPVDLSGQQGLAADDSEEHPESPPCPYYRRRNHLGNLISGRGYSLKLNKRRRPGETGAPPPLSPLLSVNSEARNVARGFYRVQLPYPHPDGSQTLCLNPEHDVIYLQPEDWVRSLLADFLHDFKANDPKGKGVVHLALHRTMLLTHHPTGPEIMVEPKDIHPIAASSFTNILRNTLRSVFLVVGFHGRMRGLTDLQWPLKHFGQTFPLGKPPGFPTSDFEWFETDPRKGVELDLEQVPIGRYQISTVASWERVERAFGVDRRSLNVGEAEQDGGNEGDNDDNDNDNAHSIKDMADEDHQKDTKVEGGAFPRLLVCAAHRWAKTREQPDMRRGEILPPEEWREELALHLREEAKDWRDGRAWYSSGTSCHVIPRSGMKVDPATFEEMERACSTAIGWWVLPAGVLESKPIRREGENTYNLEKLGRPGLFLFKV